MTSRGHRASADTAMCLLRRSKRAGQLADTRERPTRPRDILPDWIRNEGRPKAIRPDQGDMTISSFTLALLLIATISADLRRSPVILASIGPMPLLPDCDDMRAFNRAGQ